MPVTMPSARASAHVAATILRPWSGIAVTSGRAGIAASGRGLPVFLRSRSVDQCGRKSDTTRRIAPLQYPLMRVAAAHPLEIDAPAWAPEARDAEILARAGGDPPACQRCTAFDRRAELRCPAKQRSEEHTSELQSLMRISYAVFCLKEKHKSHA